jgi:NADP-dependent aldehyde dehydrogenase
MFLLPAALASRGEAIAKGWAGSLTLGAGQFCTNPGIAVVIDGEDADAFVEAAKASLSAVGPQTMLTDGIAEAYRDGRDRVARGTGVRAVLTTTCNLRSATPYLFEVSGRDWLKDHGLSEEVFGPLGLIVRARHASEMQEIANSLQGQLTCTLHLEASDLELAKLLMPVIERKAGRVLANGFPTGVEVVDAQVHGGPYPASTNFGATSVGTMAIRRWLRPVAYQNIPAELLPRDWAESIHL